MTTETVKAWDLPDVVYLHEVPAAAKDGDALALAVVDGLCNAGLVNDGDDLPVFCRDAGEAIRGTYWVQYAQDLAYDTGALSDDKPSAWPSYCIDWQRAADELAHDYCKFHVAGVEYYVQAW